MCDLSKQPFIDVALYAPRFDEAEGVFNWLVCIHREYSPDMIQAKVGRRILHFRIDRFDCGVWSYLSKAKIGLKC